MTPCVDCGAPLRSWGRTKRCAPCNRINDAAKMREIRRNTPKPPRFCQDCGTTVPARVKRCEECRGKNRRQIGLDRYYELYRSISYVTCVMCGITVRRTASLQIRCAGCSYLHYNWHGVRIRRCCDCGIWVQPVLAASGSQKRCAGCGALAAWLRVRHSYNPKQRVWQRQWREKLRTEQPERYRAMLERKRAGYYRMKQNPERFAAHKASTRVRWRLRYQFDAAFRERTRQLRRDWARREQVFKLLAKDPTRLEQASLSQLTKLGVIKEDRP